MSAPSFPVLLSAEPLSVSPAALVAASHPLTALAGALRQAGPAFAAAWAGAAHVLAAQHTGQALTACQSGVVSGLAGCAGSMEALGDGMARAAETYRGAEYRAVVPPQSGR